jgi:hypothetical protein
MNIINAVNQLIFRLKPKPENGGKSKAFYPNEKDLIAINLISEFVDKSLTDNSKNKDIRIQKLYLILFNIYLKEYECPVATEKMINDKFNKPLAFHLFKTRSMLDAFFIENSKDLKKDIEENNIELNNIDVINAIKLNMNNLFTLKNV